MPVRRPRPVPPTGEVVRRHRQARGVSLRALAAEIGVSPATLSAVENGKTGLSVQRLHDLAAALGLSPAEFLEDPGPTPAPASSALRDQLRGDDWRTYRPLPLDAVLDAAIRAFLATGYHGSTMRSIADLAGLSVAGVYHHYPSKQDLLVRILDLAMEDLLWRMHAAREDGDTPVARIAVLVEALALFHTRRPELGLIGAGEMRSLEPHHYRRVAGLRDAVQHVLDTEIHAAAAAGDVTTDYPADAGKAIATMCTALAQWFRPFGPRTPEQIAVEYADFALRLLGAPAVPARGAGPSD